MVADEPAPEAVIDQPGVAIRACQPKPAAAAERERGVAAAVEEEERLLAAFERGGHRCGQPRRDEAAARRAFGAQIDRLDGGKTLAAETLGQVHASVTAAPRVDLGLDRRRSRDEHNGDAGAARAHHRHVARMVAHALLLLVGGIVLLVDHDQPEIGIRQEKRRASADDHADFAVRRGAPGACAQALGQRRMPLGRPHAEALGEAVEELRGQGDFGDEDERLSSMTDDLADRLEIDLRLARPGDAVEQRDAVAARGDPAQRIRGGALRRREVGPREVRFRRACYRVGRQHHAFQCSFVDQAVDHAGRDPRLRGDVTLATRKAVGEQCEDAVARHGLALRRRARKPHADALAHGAEMLAHAQRHAQDHAAGAERVTRYPVDEVAQFRLERRNIELVLDVLHAVAQARIGLGVLRPHHRGRRARSDRHGHEVAGRELEPVRHAIGIGLVQGHRNEDIDDAHGRFERLRKREGRG